MSVFKTLLKRKGMEIPQITGSQVSVESESILYSFTHHVMNDSLLSYVFSVGLLTLICITRAFQ